MKTYLFKMFFFCFTVLFISCSSNQKRYAAEEEVAATTSEYVKEEINGELAEPAVDNQSGMQTALSSSAATVGKQDSIRKFIRTADIRFRTQNVVESVYGIEAIVLKNNGFVEYSNLNSHINYVDAVRISKDTILETTHYTVHNEMIIRVPNVEMDKTLRDLVQWIDYLDHRIIRADDVSLNLLKNQLDQKRERKSANRVENAIDNRGKKLAETIEGEEILTDRERRADEALIFNLRLKDKIEYSTISLDIYQREATKKELIPYEKSIKIYQPGFGDRFIEAVKWGGNAILDVFLFIVNLWPFILIGCIVIFGYKKWKNRKSEE